MPVADELFQDVWMRVVEARVRYSPQARFTTWLYTIAHNRIVDHWRAKGLAAVSLDEEGGAPEPEAGPAADPRRVAEGRETLARFAAALTHSRSRSARRSCCTRKRDSRPRRSRRRPERTWRRPRAGCDTR